MTSPRLVAGLIFALLCLFSEASLAAERLYFIAADEIVWDFAPSYPINPMTAERFDDAAETYVGHAYNRIGRRYIKAVYREYTDAGFNTLKPRTQTDRHLGILGPVIRAEVGDTITVVFRNNTRFPVGIHPHGVFYDKASEGAHYATDVDEVRQGSKSDPIATGAHIRTGEEYTYHWQVPARAGPGPADPSSIIWLYHAHDHEAKDACAGLVGPIIVTRAGAAKPDGSPIDVDREFIALFMIFDENVSPYLNANIQRFAQRLLYTRKRDEKFVESNKKHAINGFLYGNLRGLVMTRGERVRWYLMGLGNENDIHTPHWHGNTLLHHQMREDTTEVFPATTQVLDMQPDDVGTWMFHCHVADHMNAGMMTRYTIIDEPGRAISKSSLMPSPMQHRE